jgi:transposase
MKKIGVIEDRRQQGLPSPKRPPDGTPVWMAIDISRSKAVYCLRWHGSEQRRLSTPMGVEHVGAVVEQYRGCQLHVAYEACGFGYELAWWLREHGLRVSVIAPSRVERVPGLQVKTDRVDVGKLARKLEKGDLKAIYIPTRTLHEQRQLGRAYAQCLKERKRAQIRIRSLMQENGRLGPLPIAGWKVYRGWLAEQKLPAPGRLCVQVHLQLRALAEQQAQRLKAELCALARSAAYRPLVRALTAQPGVGWHSAIRLVLELGESERFPTTDALPHYRGLTPSQYSSGELDQRGHTRKCGPGFLRALLLQCAWSAVRQGSGTDLQHAFTMLAPRLGRKRAIVAVARKLAIQVCRRWRQHLAASAPPPAALAM